MIRNGWVDPARYGRAHTGITAKLGRPLDSFASHIRLARPALSHGPPPSAAGRSAWYR